MSTDEPVATKPPPAAEPEVTCPVTTGPGLASIKAQYLDLDHKRKLVTEYLPAEAAKELEAATFQNKKKDPDDAADSTNGQPKKKFKGRMKNRPREQRAADKDRLCPHLVAEEPCRFGEKCRFSHNITEYMSTKPPDLGEKCHLFETFGKCQYGLTCRFGSQHIKGDANVVNEELYEEMKDKTLVKNILSKDVQHKLWKKKYDFGKANKLVKDIQAGSKGSKADSKDNKPTKKSVTGGAIAAVGMAAVAGLSPTVADSPEGRRFSLSGPVTDEDVVKVRPVEKKKIDFSDKLYLAPLTTVGNLPFRRLCKGFGADITCGEMAMCVNLLQGQQSEWALLKRHASEDLFGVQLCGSFPDTMTRCAQLLTETIDVDFVDMNCGCPIDLIYKKGEGCALMGRTSRFEQIVNGMTSIMDVPLTVKIRTGIFEDKNIAHTLLPRLRDWGVSMVTVHGRSREQRYTRLADWDYINYCAKVASPLPVFGNGDIMSYEDARLHREQTEVTGLMLARGALIKPWVFTEIKEARDWDISSSERLDMLKDFVNFGLEHWGSDQQGVANTRRFLLEWLSFLYRYVPVGILEQPPQKINLKPPYYFGRDELETKMASPNCADWIQISEMLLGPVPDGFTFLPKHRANAYS